MCLGPPSQIEFRRRPRVISKQWLFAAGASVVLALGVAACGDDDESSARRTAATRQRPLRHDHDRRLVDGAAVRRGGGRAVQRGEPGCRTSPSAPPAPAAASRSSAPVRPTSPTPRARSSPRRRSSARRAGSSTPRFQVANDGISVVTNPALEISCLTTDQLKQLWSDDTVTNYSELGDDADTGEPLPDAEVSLYGPGTDSGTFDYFTDAINGEEGVSRKDYQASEDDNVLVQGVAGDEAGSRYFGFSYYEQNATRSTWSRSTTATAASRRAPRRSRTARTRRSRGRCSCTRRTRRCRSPRSPGSSSSSPTTTTRSPRRR